jgi:hypothetical protein
MKILIACEYSGVVRDAFTARGHHAISCDLLPTESPGYHWEGDIFDCLKFHHYNFDLMIAHPECKYLCFSGERWITEIPGRMKLRLEAFEFFKELYNLPIKKICIENSHSIFLNREFKKPT